MGNDAPSNGTTALGDVVNRLFRVMLTTLLLALSAIIATPAHAASASVEITAPAEGSSTYGTNLTISGKAHSPTDQVFVTLEGDINVYEAHVSKGRWSRHVNEQPAGPTTACAEVRSSSGSVLAKDCNAFTVTADPSRLDIVFPEEGSVHSDSVWVVALCVQGTTVRLTMDAEETIELPCESWSVDRTYTGLAEGSHTVTASMVDQGVVVATRTRTFTVDLPDPGTVSILSPADGSSGYVGPVTVSGTASSWSNVVYLYTDGVETHAWTISETGGWEITLDSLAVGSHTICAAVKDRHNQIDARDCIAYTVQIDPSLLTITSPEEGSTNPPYLVVVEGWCAEDTTVSLSMDGGPSTEHSCLGMFRQEYSGLADGSHTVTATMLYDGAVIATRERSFMVDATPPAPPVVTSPSTADTIREPTLPLVGTAEPGGIVTVLARDGIMGSAPVADDGSWSFTLDSWFFDVFGALSGKRTEVTVTLVAFDAYGNLSAPSSYTYTAHIR
jgi:large repetitive protein